MTKTNQCFFLLSMEMLSDNFIWKTASYEAQALKCENPEFQKVVWLSP